MTNIEAIKADLRKNIIETLILEYNIDYQKFGHVDTKKVLADTEKPLNYKDKDIDKQVQGIFDNLRKQIKFKDVLDGFTTEVSWSETTPTACTMNGGMLIFNPEYARTTLEQFGEKAIEFIILHEAMHNYLEAKNRQVTVRDVNSNVMADKQVNHELLIKWPEYKEYAEKLGAFIM